MFTKLIRELTVAAKNGADPDANPRLRAAIAASKRQHARTPWNVPLRAAPATTTPSSTRKFATGYGPKGVAVIVEALTDNRNRTASDVRAAFTKFGGNLGETGSVISCSTGSVR